MLPVRAVLVALYLATLAACCIPMKRAGLEQPDAEIVVRNAKGPLGGTTVILRRFIRAPGPQEVLQDYVVETNSLGSVSFARIDTRDTVMPFMMHGVPDIGFEVCATGPEGSAVGVLSASNFNVDQPHERIELTLEPAHPDCASAGGRGSVWEVFPATAERAL